MMPCRPMPRLVYIIGPYRAPTPWGVEQNIRKAEELAFQVWNLGAVPVCPHTIGRFTDKTFPDRQMLDAGLALQKKCDVALVREGWESSVGSNAEIEAAHDAKQPIFFDVHDLRRWLWENGEKENL